jgi:U32 family peptidase
MSDNKIRKLKKPELLAPAGDLEKMKIALEFGADAVYFGIADFSLRARINKFDKVSMKKAADFCRKNKKKFYITLNIYAHNRHLKKLPAYLKFLSDISPHGLIISDPGIIRMAKKYAPRIPIHLSTQANATNVEAVKFWKEQGIKRIILARELSLKEIKEIREAVPDIELEVFVHGAMCMSYSGRCILSKWMTDRSANLGDCAQPCRWRYKLKTQNSKLKITTQNSKVDKFKSKLKSGLCHLEIVDDQDRFEMEIQEDRHGTYFFNSNDLMLLEHLDKLMEIGVDSFKIEGRAKSVYYAAVVAKAYRRAIDAIGDWKDGKIKKAVLRNQIEKQKEELEKLSSRGYWIGFLLGDEPPHSFQKDQQRVAWSFCGISLDGDFLSKRKVAVHNSVAVGDEIEAITKDDNQKLKVLKIENSQQKNLKAAHGGTKEYFFLTFSDKVNGIFLIRKQS